MHFLIDECLWTHLPPIAHRYGFAADHVTHLGMAGRLDAQLMPVILERNYTFVTNNRRDFLKLYSEIDVHMGWINFVPNVGPRHQMAMFEAAVRLFVGDDPVDLINRMLDMHSPDNFRIVTHAARSGRTRP